MLRCPGGDRLRPEDVFEVPCECGQRVEFFRDDRARPCPGCGQRLANPRLDEGCAAWCRHGRECLETRGRGGQEEG
jgi:hypothetical protein